MDISWNEERDEAVLAAIPSQVAVRGSIDRLVAARDHLVRVDLMPEHVEAIDHSLKHLYSQNSMEGAQHICWMHQALEIIRDRPEIANASKNREISLDPESEDLLDAVIETDPRLLELDALIDGTKDSLSYLLAGMEMTENDWDELKSASGALLRRLERKRRKRESRLRRLFGGAFRAMLLEISRARDAMKSDDWVPVQF